jgi:ketosteroid isomerase-like protein
VTTAGADLAQTIDAFVAAFNEPDPDLDLVMSFFAEDATYLPGKKPERRGLAAIRTQFAPQFAGRFGAMTFDVYDRVIDEPRRRATIRWVCRRPGRLSLRRGRAHQRQVHLRHVPPAAVGGR